MRFTVNGDQFDLDVETVTSRLRGRAPDPIQTHWVKVDGIRFPVEQALEAVLGISRTTFTAQVARLQFDRTRIPDQRTNAINPRFHPTASYWVRVAARHDRASGRFLRHGHARRLPARRTVHRRHRCPRT